MLKILLVLLLLAGGVGHAASFDCTKAKSPQEKAICASPELSAADDQLAAAYKAWLAAVPPEVVAEVREEQRGWLRSLAANCKSAAVESTTALAADQGTAGQGCDRGRSEVLLEIDHSEGE
jgi:uncharacterized protein